MNKNYMRYFIFGLLASLFLAAQAFAGGAPIIDLYETIDNSPTGTPSEIGPEVDISEGGDFSGNLYIVLLESLDTTDHSLANWSDVLHFNGDNDTVQLFSDPAFNTLPVDEIIASSGAGSIFASEVNSSSFELQQYFPGEPPTFDAFFNVHSDTEGVDTDVVPEPSTFLLLGAGLAGVGLLRRRFKKQM
jgi:hypothetical protein